MSDLIQSEKADTGMYLYKLLARNPQRVEQLESKGIKGGSVLMNAYRELCSDVSSHGYDEIFINAAVQVFSFGGIKSDYVEKIKFERNEAFSFSKDPVDLCWCELERCVRMYERNNPKEYARWMSEKYKQYEELLISEMELYKGLYSDFFENFFLFDDFVKDKLKLDFDVKLSLTGGRVYSRCLNNKKLIFYIKRVEGNGDIGGMLESGLGLISKKSKKLQMSNNNADVIFPLFFFFKLSRYPFVEAYSSFKQEHIFKYICIVHVLMCEIIFSDEEFSRFILPC